MIEIGKFMYYLAKAYRADGQEGKALELQRKAKIYLVPRQSNTHTPKRFPGISIDSRFIQEIISKIWDIYSLYRRFRGR